METAFLLSIDCSKSSRPFLFLFAGARSGLFGFSFGYTLKLGQRARVLQAATGLEDNLRFLDLGIGKLLFRQCSGRTDGQSETADFAELDDAARLQMLVKNVVHTVHHRLYVGRGQGTLLGDVGAKLVKGHVAVTDCLRVELARVLARVLPQIPTVNQLVFLCHNKCGNGG